jgi:hypothetical protein
MDEVQGQGVGFQMAKALLLSKKNDTIFKKFKTHGRKLYKEQFVEINVTKEEFISDWDNVKVWEKFNNAKKTLEKFRMGKLECINT